eukprot:m.581920 g.581920  ORF g.581920 m.581920 type:complete len:60 (+) comp22334_c1_seq10:4266-4445(+)
MDRTAEYSSMLVLVRVTHQHACSHRGYFCPPRFTKRRTFLGCIFQFLVSDKRPQMWMFA